VLAQEVLVEQGLPEGALLGAESNGVVGAAGDLLQDGGVRRRLRGRCPHVKGPLPATSTAGTAIGSMSANASTITWPVARS
jgi:hypothetical protein